MPGILLKIKPFPPLPVELVHEILHNAAALRGSALLACLVLSRSINHLLQSILYRSITIASIGDLDHFVSLSRVNSPTSDPSPLRHVQKLWLGLQPRTFPNLLEKHDRSDSAKHIRTHQIHAVLASSQPRHLNLHNQFHTRLDFQPPLNLAYAGDGLEELTVVAYQLEWIKPSMNGLIQKLHLVNAPTRFETDVIHPLHRALEMGVMYLDLIMPFDAFESRVSGFDASLDRFPRLSHLLIQLSWSVNAKWKSSTLKLLKQVKEILGTNKRGLKIVISVWFTSGLQPWCGDANEMLWLEAGYPGQEGQEESAWDLLWLKDEEEWQGRRFGRELIAWRIM